MVGLKAVGTCLVGLLLTASAVRAQNLTPDNLEAMAKREGQVVWYTDSGSSEWLRPVLELWKKRYPEIAVVYVESSGAENMERVRTERRASNRIADLISIGDGAAFQFTNENALAPVDVKLLSNFKSLSSRLNPVLDTEHRHIPTYVMSYGIVVNTSLLPEKDQPSKWTDLLDPKYSGKMAIQDLGRIGGGLSWMMIGESTLGENFFQKLLSQQKLRVIARSTEVFSTVARGERAIGLPGGSNQLQSYTSAPIKIVYPKDGTFFISQNTGIVANAPHPAAATLFLNFLLSREVQEQFVVAGGHISVRDDVPSDKITLANTSLLGTGLLTPSDVSKIPDALEKGKKLMQP